MASRRKQFGGRFISYDHAREISLIFSPDFLNFLSRALRQNLFYKFRAIVC